MVGGGDAQCVLCRPGAAVSLGGVSAPQTGGQLDADEGLRFFAKDGQEGQEPGAVKECIFAIYKIDSAGKAQA